MLSKTATPIVEVDAVYVYICVLSEKSLCDIWNLNENLVLKFQLQHLRRSSLFFKSWVLWSPFNNGDRKYGIPNRDRIWASECDLDRIESINIRSIRKEDP